MSSKAAICTATERLHRIHGPKRFRQDHSPRSRAGLALRRTMNWQTFSLAFAFHGPLLDWEGPFVRI